MARVLPIGTFEAAHRAKRPLRRPWSASTPLFAYWSMVVRGWRDQLVQSPWGGRPGRGGPPPAACPMQVHDRRRSRRGKVTPGRQPDVDEQAVLDDRAV